MALLSRKIAGGLGFVDILAGGAVAMIAAEPVMSFIPYVNQNALVKGVAEIAVGYIGHTYAPGGSLVKNAIGVGFGVPGAMNIIGGAMGMLGGAGGSGGQIDF